MLVGWIDWIRWIDWTMQKRIRLTQFLREIRRKLPGKSHTDQQKNWTFGKIYLDWDHKLCLGKY